MSSDEKSGLRSRMRELRREVSAEVRAAASQSICDQVLKLREINEESVVSVYFASAAELDIKGLILELIGRGIKVVAPRWNGTVYELARVGGISDEFLRSGPMNILEPKAAEVVSPEVVTLWVVPGLAFTRGGLRLGYGGGWYDRLLSRASATALKLGVAYDFQLLESLPCEPHDIRLDRVIIADR